MTETTTDTYPYTLQVEPNPRREESWQWAIRRHGKMIQRSDRDHPSEAKARAQGMGQIEKLLNGRDRGLF
jgi:hypothetical protein